MEREKEKEEKKKKILLIEDDKAYLHMLHEKLCDEGYYVVMAGGTDAAKDWALRKLSKLDMIISDQKMPGEEGSSFLAFLSELEKTNPEKLDPTSELYQKIRKRFVNLADGEFKELIQNIAAPSCIRVILSGYAEDEKTEEALEKGHFHKFISKKIGIADILSTIRSLFEEAA